MIVKREFITMSNKADRSLSSVVRAGDFVFVSGVGGSKDAPGNPVEGIEAQDR